MKPLICLWAALSTGLCLELACCGIGPVSGASAGLAPSGLVACDSTPRLTACEEQILRDPFAPKASRPTLTAALPHALEDSKRRVREIRFEQQRDTLLPPMDHFQMGWSISDRSYWEAIPAAARSIPVDWS